MSPEAGAPWSFTGRPPSRRRRRARDEGARPDEGRCRPGRARDAAIRVGGDAAVLADRLPRRPPPSRIDRPTSVPNRTSGREACRPSSRRFCERRSVTVTAGSLSVPFQPRDVDEDREEAVVDAVRRERLRGRGTAVHRLKSSDMALSPPLPSHVRAASRGEHGTPSRGGCSDRPGRCRSGSRRPRGLRHACRREATRTRRWGAAPDLVVPPGGRSGDASACTHVRFHRPASRSPRRRRQARRACRPRFHRESPGAYVATAVTAETRR